MKSPVWRVCLTCYARGFVGPHVLTFDVVAIRLEEAVDISKARAMKVQRFKSFDLTDAAIIGYKDLQRGTSAQTALSFIIAHRTQM